MRKAVRLARRTGGKASRFGKRVYHVARLLPHRCTAAVRRNLRRVRGPRAPTVITAVTARFPLPYTTFAYQEILGFEELMGARVRLLYWLEGARDGLHGAYQRLARNAVRLRYWWDVHLADRRHFERRYPQRVRTLFELLARETGRSVDDLRREPLMLHAFSFARRVEEEAPDYIHTYFFYEQTLFALVASWLLGIPRGVSAYADHMMADYPLKLVRLHVETADVVVATSRRIKEELIGLSDARFADKIVVKPNAPDGERFPYVERALRDSGPLELLSISRIEEKKGLLTLVDAARLLKDARRPVRFHVVGTGDPDCVGSVDYARRFEQRLDELDVRDLFVRHGFLKHDELQPLLERCHAFIAPYVETARGDKDGIPTSMLEAMATGLPVLCTDSGSIHEVVSNGIEGLVFAQNSPDQLVAVVERVLQEPALCLELGRRAHDRFRREFDYRVTERRFHDRVLATIAASSEENGQPCADWPARIAE